MGWFGRKKRNRQAVAVAKSTPRREEQQHGFQAPSPTVDPWAKGLEASAVALQPMSSKGQYVQENVLPPRGAAIAGFFGAKPQKILEEEEQKNSRVQGHGKGMEDQQAEPLVDKPRQQQKQQQQPPKHDTRGTGKKKKRNRRRERQEEKRKQMEVSSIPLAEQWRNLLKRVGEGGQVRLGEISVEAATAGAAAVTLLLLLVALLMRSCCRHKEESRPQSDETAEATSPPGKEDGQSNRTCSDDGNGRRSGSIRAGPELEPQLGEVRSAAAAAAAAAAVVSSPGGPLSKPTLSSLASSEARATAAAAAAVAPAELHGTEEEEVRAGDNEAEDASTCSLAVAWTGRLKVLTEKVKTADLAGTSEQSGERQQQHEFELQQAVAQVAKGAPVEKQAKEEPIGASCATEPPTLDSTEESIHLYDLHDGGAEERGDDQGSRDDSNSSPRGSAPLSSTVGSIRSCTDPARGDEFEDESSSPSLQQHRDGSNMVRTKGSDGEGMHTPLHLRRCEDVSANTSSGSGEDESRVALTAVETQEMRDDVEALNILGFPSPTGCTMNTPSLLLHNLGDERAHAHKLKEVDLCAAQEGISVRVWEVSEESIGAAVAAATKMATTADAAAAAVSAAVAPPELPLDRVGVFSSEKSYLVLFNYQRVTVDKSTGAKQQQGSEKEQEEKADGLKKEEEEGPPREALPALLYLWFGRDCPDDVCAAARGQAQGVLLGLSMTSGSAQQQQLVIQHAPAEGGALPRRPDGTRPFSLPRVLEVEQGKEPALLLSSLMGLSPPKPFVALDGRRRAGKAANTDEGGESAMCLCPSKDRLRGVRVLELSHNPLFPLSPAVMASEIDPPLKDKARAVFERGIKSYAVLVENPLQPLASEVSEGQEQEQQLVIHQARVKPVTYVWHGRNETEAMESMINALSRDTSKMTLPPPATATAAATAAAAARRRNRNKRKNRNTKPTRLLWQLLERAVVRHIVPGWPASPEVWASLGLTVSAKENEEGNEEEEEEKEGEGEEERPGGEAGAGEDQLAPGGAAAPLRHPRLFEIPPRRALSEGGRGGDVRLAAEQGNKPWVSEVGAGCSFGQSDLRQESLYCLDDGKNAIFVWMGRGIGAGRGEWSAVQKQRQLAWRVAKAYAASLCERGLHPVGEALAVEEVRAGEEPSAFTACFRGWRCLPFATETAAAVDDTAAGEWEENLPPLAGESIPGPSEAARPTSPLGDCDLFLDRS